jgi:DNA-binding LacI/PurR family transcriptional regulator
MSIVLIARRAGVSTATVSRVLNDLPGVRDETKQQVRSAVEELNYVTPLIKRGRKPGSGKKLRPVRRTDTIAVMAVGDGKDWLQLPVMAATVSGIARAASQAGLKVLLEEMRDVSKPSPLLMNGEVDGAIVFLSSGLKPDDFRNVLVSLQQHVPVVWAMGGDAGITAVDHIIPDDRAITRLAFDYLRAQGRTQLAFVTTAPKWAMMRNRGQVFAGLAHDAGMDWSVYLVGDDQGDGDLFGRRAVVEPSLNLLMDRLARATPRPDGLFIGNDAATAMIHPMLLQRGISPGKEILLVSCDNEEIRLHGLEPRPLSIDIGSTEVGATAVRRLRFRIEHPGEPPIMIKVAPSLPGQLAAHLAGHLPGHLD